MLLKQNQPVCAALKHAVTGQAAPYDTTVQFCLRGRMLTVCFVAEDSALQCAATGYNQNIFDGSVCEVFLGGKKSYYEFEIAPNGSLFFARIEYDEAKDEPLLTYLDTPPKAGVQVSGSRYQAEVSFDLDELRLENEFYLNAFRIEQRGEEQNLMALNPPMRNRFHTPNVFEKVVLAE